MMSDYHYRAFCGKCGATKSESKDGDFLTIFFLGRRCNSCGEYKGKWNHKGDILWRVEFGLWESKFKLFKPSTWLIKAEWVEFIEKDNQ